MGITQYSQTDPQWKSNLLGFDSTSTIGGYGCLLTSMAMVATGYGASGLTPAALNDKMKAINGFQAGTAFLIGWMVGNVVPGMSLDYRSSGGSAPLAEIDANLAQGNPAIIEVDWSPQAGVQTHYMVAYAKSGSDYLVYDPYPYPTSSGQIKLSTSKYASVAGSSDPAKIITGVFFTKGPTSGPVTPPTPPSLDTGVHASFPVYAAADQLALRSQPVIADSTLINRYPVNTQFQVLASDSTANSQVGQQNVWMAVKAPNGTQGYVAAWLVSKSQTNATPAPSTGSAPVSLPVPANPPVVKTTVDAVKLRSTPDNTDATVLKVLPLGTELKVLEPASNVQSKVGVMYSWLRVADVTGIQGSVAAWYVSVVSLGAYGPTAQSQAAAPNFAVMAEPQPLLMRTTEEGVAMRTRGFIAKHTLKLRMPRGTELISLEKPATAAKKLGKTGKWMRVKDVKGNKGYVAAWLLKERPADPSPLAAPKDS